VSIPSNPQNDRVYTIGLLTYHNKDRSKMLFRGMVTVQLITDGVSRQAEIGVHQFDYCLSHNKTNVTTVNNQLLLAIFKMSGEFFIFQQDGTRFSSSG